MQAYLTLLLLLSIFCCACDQSKVKIAPEIMYYFEVKCGLPEPECYELKQSLEKSIPLYKYTITHQSGKKWPYYQAFETRVPVPADSLMPPHWQVHRMVLKKDGEKINQGKYLVQIDIFSVPDTIPDFNVTIYKMERSGLSLSATSGIHYVDMILKDSTLTFQDTFLKYILRYSFK